MQPKLWYWWLKNVLCSFFLLLCFCSSVSYEALIILNWAIIKEYSRAYLSFWVNYVISFKKLYLHHFSNIHYLYVFVYGKNWGVRVQVKSVIFDIFYFLCYVYFNMICLSSYICKNLSSVSCGSLSVFKNETCWRELEKEMTQVWHREGWSIISILLRFEWTHFRIQIWSYYTQFYLDKLSNRIAVPQKGLCFLGVLIISWPGGKQLSQTYMDVPNNNVQMRYGWKLIIYYNPIFSKGVLSLPFLSHSPFWLFPTSEKCIIQNWRVSYIY